MLEILQKMISTNIYWITGFSFLLLTLHFLYPLIFKYIDDKPMGHQSIFDLALKDHFMISRFNGTIYCLVAISSRIDPVAKLMTDFDILAISVSSLYDFAFAFGCISTGINLIKHSIVLKKSFFCKNNLALMKYDSN
jgi:hypothetical protein